MSHSNERGIALLTTLLVMMLISAILVAFTTVIMSDQRYRFIDKDRGQAFYGAEAGVEKLTADLGTLFLQNVAPTNAQILALTGTTMQPVLTIPGQTAAAVSYTSTVQPTPLPASEMTSVHCYNTAAQVGPPAVAAVNRAPVTVGGNGYAISFCADTSTNNPTTLADSKTITQGTYAGLYALKTPYQIDVTARTPTGGEVHLVRTMETVSIPVFQFGIFSDVDLAFNAADDFSFGGRVHTNGNLFLSQNNGSTLTMSDKVTAYKEVIRQVLSNGNSITASGVNKNGTVTIAKGGGAFRVLAATEGSVTGGVGSPYNTNWPTQVSPAYFGYLKNGSNGDPTNGTGAKKLSLPIVAPGVGGENIDLIRRPTTTESITSIKYQERLFAKASIRILLSDIPGDITSLPGIDISAAPLSLEAGRSYPAAAIAAFSSQPIPMAASQGPGYATATATQGAGAGKTVTMAATPAAFRTFDMTTSTGTSTFTITGCTGKTYGTVAGSTTFTGCTVTRTAGAATNIPNNSTITSTVGGETTTTVGATAVGGTPAGSATTTGVTFTVTPATNLAFSPSFFWINDTMVPCTGYTTTTLTGCTLATGLAVNDVISNFFMSPKDTGTIGGYIKVERQNANDSTWHDITPEFLNYGIADAPQTGSCSDLTKFTNPSPNALIRLQRLADDAGDLQSATSCIAHTAAVPAVPAAAPNRLRLATAYDYWPMTLWDAREAWQRETAPAGTNLKFAGVMQYVSLDAGNLAKWFKGTAPYTVANGSTGTQAKTDNGGFSVYISDRRSNRNLTNQETGEFGFEDNVNPSNTSDVPNGTLDAGEDLNANTTLETYGGTLNCNGQSNYVPGNAVTNGGSTITCATATAFSNPSPPANPKSDMTTTAESGILNGVGRAMVNRPLMFRRAVKVTNGKNLVANVTGFTIVSENPVYVQGDYNANSAGTNTWDNPDTAAAIIADAVTVLSNNWEDINSFPNPYDTTKHDRDRTVQSWYRFAILAGKNAIFPLPSVLAASAPTFGTDGGAHAFMHYLEGKVGGDTINYQGSMATMFYSRQAVGIFKGNDGFVYGIPANRNYFFDTNFLSPNLLPPLTPMFRDNNAVGFSQQLQPGK